MPKTYEPIATVTASGSSGIVNFTSIDQTFTDIVLVCNTYTTTTSYGALSVNVQVGNGSVDTGSNYSYTFLEGNGSTASSNGGSNITVYPTAHTGTAQSGSNNWSVAVINFMNYSNTTTNKTIISRYNVPAGAGAKTGADVALWRSTAAINTIKLELNVSQNFASGSTFTLYGIKAA